MRLLITGHEGFTGRYLSQHARQNGYEVFALQLNLCDKAALCNEIFKVAPSHVVHLAAISAATHEEHIEIYQSNLIGSLNLLECLKQLPVQPQKIILASSAYVYGNRHTQLPLDEKMLIHPMNHYAISKYAMELMAQTFIRDLPIIITRPFNYTGVGHDQRFVIPKIIAHYAQQKKLITLGEIDSNREYNDVRDVVDIYLRLLEHGQDGEIYNIASGRPVTVRAVLSNLDRMTERSLQVVQDQQFMRNHEVTSLVGNAQKLVSTIGSVQWRPLDETLEWMLKAANAST